jgi:hypothetical protein
MRPPPRVVGFRSTKPPSCKNPAEIEILQETEQPSACSLAVARRIDPRGHRPPPVGVDEASPTAPHPSEQASSDPEAGTPLAANGWAYGGPGAGPSQDLAGSLAAAVSRSRTHPATLEAVRRPAIPARLGFARHGAANAQMARNANRSPVAGSRMESGTRGRNRARHGTAGQAGALFEGRVSGGRRDRRRRRNHGRLGWVAVLNTTTSVVHDSASGEGLTRPDFRVETASRRIDPECNHQGIQNQLLGPAPTASRGRPIVPPRSTSDFRSAGFLHTTGSGLPLQPRRLGSPRRHSPRRLESWNCFFHRRCPAHGQSL